MAPDAKGVKMVPINRMVPRSFITNLRDNATVRRGVPIEVRGIAFGGDTGVKNVAFSADGGASWQNAALGKDYGRYSFRRWHTSFVPKQPGTYKLMANATNSNNLSQPATVHLEPRGLYAQRDRTSHGSYRIEEQPMARTRQGIILAAILTGLTATLAHGIALAQSAATPSHHRTIRLTSQKIALPFGDKTFAGAGEDAKIANEHCLLCHSKGMIDTQPPLSLETWKKESEKMRTAYGCPLRADLTSEVAAFISHAVSAPAAGGE